MKISIILAHPDKNSFNHAIAALAVSELQKNGYDVNFHDLYAENFDPCLPSTEISSDAYLLPEIKKHCDEISSADGIVIVHPNWWGQSPAILKGWVDRVIRPGIAYRFQENDKGEGVPVGLLKADTAIVFNTSNTPREREENVFGDPLELIWKNCIFELCGVKTFHREIFRVIVTSTAEERKKWLEQVSCSINKFFPGI